MAHNILQIFVLNAYINFPLIIVSIQKESENTYFGNDIRTLFSSLLWFFVAIVVFEVNCYLGHVKNVM